MIFLIRNSHFDLYYLYSNTMEVEAARLFVNALMLFMRSQFSFVIGMVLTKENMLDCSKWLSRIKNNPILPWIFLVVMITGRAVLRHMILASFSAIVLIILFGTYNLGKLGEKTLLFFGNHSTNMWLTHMQFCILGFPLWCCFAIIVHWLFSV